MATEDTPSSNHISEEESRRIAEQARADKWISPSFMKELFLGNFRFDLIHPYPRRTEWRPQFLAFFGKLKAFLRDHTDPVEIDVSGEYPPEVIDGLRELGAFGMKIPRKYGGLGFDQVEYAKCMELIGAHDGNIVALLSAHQSIGVPQPIKLFGTTEQKEKYLPRCAKGEISAFALTEPDVGSDPARVATTLEKTPEGDAYILNGRKLWCTNGTIAKMLVVMAKHKGTRKISALVVETDSPGVTVEHRCRFMGLRAISNALLSFKDVRVPVENLIGKEGRGLKIALTTLNDGRLSIPNANVGAAKRCLNIVRKWASTRSQWGKPVGRHEALGHKIADMAATTFAMESIVKLSSHLANDKRIDLRLESAACKEWNTARGWDIIDETMQIRGGRGYETETSLKARGDDPEPVERIMRDARINRIFEGSSEIMHLLIAREAVDKHLSVAGAMVDPKSTFKDKMSALPDILKFYAVWYPSRWLGWSLWPKYAGYGKLGKHLRFIERSARRLARGSFHGMAVYQAKLEKKQAFMFRLVDIVMELFAMSASVSRAHTLVKNGDTNAEQAVELADVFCRRSSRKVQKLFWDLWANDDVPTTKLSKGVLDGRQVWMEELLAGLVK